MESKKIIQMNLFTEQNKKVRLIKNSRKVVVRSWGEGKEKDMRKKRVKDWKSKEGQWLEMPV